MPQFYFRRCDAPRSLDYHAHNLADLRQAMIMANRLARRIVRRDPAAEPTRTGSLDIENEDRRVVARIMLADVARQMS